ncbi:AAA family ATPase [Streptomyces nogalater]
MRNDQEPTTGGDSELTAGIRRVLARVDAHAARTGQDRSTGQQDDPGTARTPAPALTTPLDALVTLFGLTLRTRRRPAHRRRRTRPDHRRPVRRGLGRPTARVPHLLLALAALGAPHWSALTPVAPLRRWRIVEPEDETRLTVSRLRLDERVLHFLLDSPYLDARLHGRLRRTTPPDALPPSYDLAAGKLAEGWREDGRGPGAPPVVEVTGGDPRSRAELAAAAAARCGLGLYAMSAAELPTDPAERDRLARLWQREAILLPAALLVEAGDLDRDQRAATEAFLAAPPCPSSSPARTRCPPGARPAAAWPCPAWTTTNNSRSGPTRSRAWPDWPTANCVPWPPSSSCHRTWSAPPRPPWAAAWPTRTRRTPPNSPGGPDWRRPASAWTNWAAGQHPGRAGTTSCCTTVRPLCSARSSRMCGSGLPSTRSGDSPRPCAGARRHRAVRGRLRHGQDTRRRGHGRELGLDLFVVDLSQVVSKYIGETEKNLRRVFDAAERGGALLLFDEADALFGKRSEVKDSHDRYANLEVSYLLMRMEAYRGLAILTTNMKQALDTAFLRRIRFVVDFPFPAEHERAEIWRRVLPPQAPLKDIDPDLLARLTVAGGSIRNIALSGAFLAAEEGDRLQMRHMLAAARTEYLKLERSLTPAEVRGWV